jgi:hypothetical protein
MSKIETPPVEIPAIMIPKETSFLATIMEGNIPAIAERFSNIPKNLGLRSPGSYENLHRESKSKKE